MQRTFEERQGEFEKVKQRIYSILLEHPEGLYEAQIQIEYISKFKHSAEIGPRLREEVHPKGEHNLIRFYDPARNHVIWKLNPEQWSKKK